MAEYDLTSRIITCMDPHMAISLVDFLETDVSAYSREDLSAAKLELLGKTKMLDATIQLQEELHGNGNVSSELQAERTKVLEQLDDFQEQLKPVFDLFDNEEALAEIQKKAHQSDALIAALQPYGYNSNMPDLLFSSAKLYYDIGQYEEAAQFLYNFRVLSADADRNFSALWGKLAAEIMSGQWESANDDLNLLLEYIDGSKATPLQQLHQRTWLLHWSLFVFFNQEKGPEGVIDFFLKKDACCNALQMMAPYLLRYVAVVAIIMRRERHSVLYDLIKLVRQESVTYSDPVLRFVLALTVDFNFEEAQKELKECDKVFATDFFINGFHQEFVECARLYIFEIYCQIHSTISIKMLADQLEMSEEKAEEWIVNLIRKAKLDAKIDSTEGHVTMSTQVPSIYQQVLDRTKGLSLRTRLIVDNLERQNKRGKKSQQRKKQ